MEVQVDEGPWIRLGLTAPRDGSGSQTDDGASTVAMDHGTAIPGRHSYAWKFWHFEWGSLPRRAQVRSRAFDVYGNIQPAPDDPFSRASEPTGRATGRSPVEFSFSELSGRGLRRDSKSRSSMVYDFERFLISSLSPSPRGRFEHLSEWESVPFLTCCSFAGRPLRPGSVQFGRRRQNRNGYAWEGELFRQDHGISIGSTMIETSIAVPSG